MDILLVLTNSRFLGLQDQGTLKNECCPVQPCRREPASPLQVALPLPNFLLFFLPLPLHPSQDIIALEPNQVSSFCKQKFRILVFFLTYILAFRTFWRVQSYGVVLYLDCLRYTLYCNKQMWS